MPLGCFAISRQDAPPTLDFGSVSPGVAAVAVRCLRPLTFDRNMLVKHYLLDSFGASGLVLVGFVGGLVQGVL